jgi:hypothetical protein
MTHNTESSAVWNLRPERWGSPLVQEKYQGEKACDKRRNNNNNLARRRIPEDRCLVTFVRITSLQVDSGKWHLQNTNQNYQPLGSLHSCSVVGNAVNHFYEWADLLVMSDFTSLIRLSHSVSWNMLEWLEININVLFVVLVMKYGCYTLHYDDKYAALTLRLTIVLYIV